MFLPVAIFGLRSQHVPKISSQYLQNMMQAHTVSIKEIISVPLIWMVYDYMLILS
jgi:hypothetical protein